MVSTTTKLFHLATRLWVTGHAHLSNSISTLIWLPHPRVCGPLCRIALETKRGQTPRRVIGSHIAYLVFASRTLIIIIIIIISAIQHPLLGLGHCPFFFSRSFRLLFQQTNCLAYIQSSLNVGLSRRPSFPSPSIIVFISVIPEITRSPLCIVVDIHALLLLSLSPFPFPSLPHES